MSTKRSQRSRASALEHQSRLILGVGLLSIGLALLLKLLWPILLVVGVGAGSYWLWLKQYQQFVTYQQKEDRLIDCFCSLLEQRQGRISSLEFAMYARVESRQAQRYLHAQAQSFGAFFERTVHGDIIYIFNPAVVYSLEPRYAPPTAYIDAAYVRHTQQNQPRASAEVAWTNAQQLAERQPEKDFIPTVRGQAVNVSENVKTIDVSVVNE